MGKIKNKYSAHYKLKIVKEALETKNSSMVARNHELNPSMVNRWLREYKSVGESNFLAGKVSGGKNNGPSTDSEKKAIEEENKQLKKLLGEKDLEIEILKDLVKKNETHYQKK